MIPVGYWMIFRILDKKRRLKNEKQRATTMATQIRNLTGVTE